MEERQSQYALEIITVYKEQYNKSPSGFEDSPLGAWISWEAILQYGAPLRAHLIRRIETTARRLGPACPSRGLLTPLLNCCETL